MKRSRPLSVIVLSMTLVSSALVPVFGQVGPDVDTILSNQKAAEEARRKERGVQDSAKQESDRRMREEIRAEVIAATRSAETQPVVSGDEVERLRAELAEARKTIASLTAERDALRRTLDATTRSSR